MPTVHDRSSSDLAAAFEQSLGRWRALAAKLVTLAERHGVGPERLEPSLRGGEGLPLRGARMMIEQVPRAHARELLALLVPEAAATVEAWLELAASERVPVIAGWDAGGPAPKAKLYLNASDASEAVRRRIARHVRVARDGVPSAPHVIGVNLVGDHREVKVYEQREALGEGAPGALLRWAKGLEASGAVRSVSVRDETVAERAWFVSLRPDVDAERRLAALPGWSETAAARCLPPRPGTVTSVGFSSDGRRWTAYFKPRGIDVASWKLDPDVCVAHGATELGIFVEPTALATRAYHRSGCWAVSYRVREGQPDPHAIDRVMQWAVARVRARTDGGPFDFSQPPEPWRVVGTR